jgi:UDP-glucuronate 4-epimerase
VRAFITGAAGFIGFHLARRLLELGHEVTGYDGITDYYDPALKRARLSLLQPFQGFNHIEGMLEDGGKLEAAIADAQPEVVLHLAAQAGVRYSIEAPHSYIQSNVVGTGNLLEALRRHRPRHLIFASTSSVYGGNSKMPFAETDATDGPVSLYAATKKSGEAMVHAYAHLFGIPATCMRFFTVYGPWGRPDMAAIKFFSAMLEGRQIEVYGHGKMRRDFTFIDDLIGAIVALVDRVPEQGQPVAFDSLSPVAPFRIVNVAGGKPVELMEFISALECVAGVTAKLELMPMQAGDVVATAADTRLLEALIGAAPETPLEVGLSQFAAWYKEYHLNGSAR